MRLTLAALPAPMLAAPLLALTACGGGGDGVVASLGSIAPPISSVTSGAGTASTQTSFLDVTAATTFDANAGLQSLSYDAKGASLYRGDAGTPAAPNGTISYSPRDGIFTLTLTDQLAGVTRDVRYQDPEHRTTPQGSVDLQVSQLTGFNYLSALDGTDDSTFFYERPGVTTAYVSLAGFEHTTVKPKTGTDTHDTTLEEQGAFVFGQKTPAAQVPGTGSGHFSGDFLASMTGGGGGESRLQWISGTSSVDVDFARFSLALALSGTVLPTYLKNDRVPEAMLAIPTGSAFAANAIATLDPTRANFSGKFASAGFANGGASVPVDFTSVNAANNIAGASSVDGSFYGPNAVNVGGSFRITGGIPNQRVDILGAFAGAKK